MRTKEILIANVSVIATGIDERRVLLQLEIRRRVHDPVDPVILFIFLRILHEHRVCKYGMGILRLLLRVDASCFVEGVIGEHGFVQGALFPVPFRWRRLRHVIEDVVQEIHRILKHLVVEPVHLFRIIDKDIIQKIRRRVVG
ncbi:hypothetical protein D3C81_1134940 [compost metagenome]